MSSLVAKAVSATSRVPASACIAGLIERLSDVQNAFCISWDLIRCGSAAVPFLAEALRFGKPQSIPQPRCCLVDVLATLGANDILLEYLRDNRPIDDPQIRFAEDAVMSVAAKTLKLDFSAEAYCTLLAIAQDRAIPGVLEALAMYRRIGSIPCFLRALEGDLSRPTAIGCLKSFGGRARSLLLTEVFEPRPREREVASSLHRRRACLEVLTTLRLDRSDYAALVDLLSEQDIELVLNVGRVLLASGDKSHHEAAVRRLKALRANADWFLRDELDLLVLQLEEKGDNQ